MPQIGRLGPLGPRRIIKMLPRDRRLSAAGHRLPRFTRTVWLILRQHNRVPQPPPPPMYPVSTRYSLLDLVQQLYGENWLSHPPSLPLVAQPDKVMGRTEPFDQETLFFWLAFFFLCLCGRFELSQLEPRARPLLSYWAPTRIWWAKPYLRRRYSQKSPQNEWF